MKKDWTYKKLGDITTTINGLWTGKKPPFINVAVVRNTNFTKDCKLDMSNVAYLDVEEKQYKTRKLQYGDIIIEKSGGSEKQPVGRPVLFNIKDGEYSFSNFTSALRVNNVEEIDPHFLHYALISAYFRGVTGKMQSKTTGIHNLDFKAYLKLQIPYTSKFEQQQIVSELDLLSSVIEKQKAQIEELNKLSQSIFYDMFKDFADDTPISDYVINLAGGKSLAGKIECENKVLKTGAVTFDYFNGDEVKYLPVDYTPQPEHLVKDGDVLVSRMNTPELVGACAYVWKAPEKTYLPDRLWRAYLKDNISPIYLWVSLIQPKAKEQIRSLASGTSGSMKNISKPKFMSVKIKGVPLALQKIFAEKIEAIEIMKSKLHQSLKETEQLFNSRMDFYFN